MSKRKYVNPLTEFEYKILFWDEFDYTILQHCKTVKRPSKVDPASYAEILIGADTETSKTGPDRYEIKKKKVKGKPVETRQYIPQENIVVAWSLSIRLPGLHNVVTLYGTRPSEFASCLEKLRTNIPADRFLIYFHNLAYDWVFLERHLIDRFGIPCHQLNTKPHYPVSVQFDNGIMIRDSLILAGTRLEKWADDLDVDHKKAVGKWDYNKFRNQGDSFNADELLYIECDVLALVECLDKIRAELHHHVYSIPLTQTSIVRAQVRAEGRKAGAREKFLKVVPEFTVYNDALVPSYHGGFTHANRNTRGIIWAESEINYPIICGDIASSYPYVMLTGKIPDGKLRRRNGQVHGTELLKYYDTTSFVFRWTARNVRLKDPEYPMPVLQFSKCDMCINSERDNGRILSADFVSIIINEVDFRLINEMYDYDGDVCSEIYSCHKDYLPKWYRDLVFRFFSEKCEKKGGDPVAYALAKARVNSLYGMCCQRCIRAEIAEDYETGEFIDQYELLYDDESKTLDEIKETIRHMDEEAYKHYVDSYNSILPYQWGCWITSIAMSNLFDIGRCVKSPEDGGAWLYSDTDSVYAFGWDDQKLAALNELRKRQLIEAGYGPVVAHNKEFWVGVVESDPDDDTFSEFIALHSKCYAARNKKSGKIKLTVAGVPKKKGAACLNDDLNNFRDGFVFPGEDTGKLTHFYFTIANIYTDANGNEHGNSVDLAPCDYQIGMPDASKIIEVAQTEEVRIQIYDDIED